MRRPRLEICVDGVEAAELARRAGADRLEVCAALELEGLSPGPGVLEVLTDRLDVPVVAMVRPRPGGFHYRGAEVEVLLAEVRRAAALGLEGVALGCLLPDGGLDLELAGRLRDAASGTRLVFHRAIDLVAERGPALAALERLGWDRVLSSGAAATAALGAARLRADAEAHPRLGFVAAGGVRPGPELEALLEAPLEGLHASARGPALPAPADEGPLMAGDSGLRRRIDPAVVAALRSRIDAPPMV